MASRKLPPPPVAIPTVITGKFSSVNSMLPLEGVGDSLVLAVTGSLREGREADDACLAVEIKE